ncbi:P-loop containing nucleoside triphosphate hydrolase protein, partial [Suillus ampliporus]
KMEIQVILLTATMPPHRLDSYLKPFRLKKDAILTVRYATNRPEIGMHVVHVEPIAAKQSLAHIVHALKTLLKDEERILVFFGANRDAGEFGKENKSAVYHSELWEAGNTKAYNLDLWDRGESKVMACTTAFAQGIDRSNVRFVLIFRPAYGLLVNNQMLGRAGRDGLESHVFFV